MRNPLVREVLTTEDHGRVCVEGGAYFARGHLGDLPRFLTGRIELEVGIGYEYLVPRYLRTSKEDCSDPHAITGPPGNRR
jgi:hypothetical protein